MVATLRVQQIMAEQLTREYLLFLSCFSPNYYAYFLKGDYECKYCYPDLQ
jgi:hypothetical protein